MMFIIINLCSTMNELIHALRDANNTLERTLTLKKKILNTNIKHLTKHGHNKSFVTVTYKQ